MTVTNESQTRAQERDRKPLRPYPLFTIDDAAEVAIAIYRFNGGHPWPPPDVARALDMGARTPRFYYLTAAARDYGLTLGTRDANKIELTDLGRRLAMASDPAAARALKREAVRRVEIFRRVLDYYHGGPLPEFRFVGNTLQGEFGLAPEIHGEFLDLITRNLTSTASADLPAPAANPMVQTADVSRRLDAPPDRRARDLRTIAAPPLIAVPKAEPSDLPPGFFQEVSRSLIRPAVDAIEATSRDLSSSDMPYQSEVVQSILAAPIAILDITTPDPVVAFSLGLRLGAGLPLVLIAASGTTLPIDLDTPVVEYNRNLWPSTLQDDLARLTTIIRQSLSA